MPQSSAPSPPRKRAVALRAVLIAVPLVVLLGGVVLLSYRSESALIHDNLLTDQRAFLRLRAGMLTTHVQDILRDVRFLASGPAVSAMAGNGDPDEGRRLLGRVFLSLMDAKPYDQVRFIDRTGQEVVRVDRSGGVAHVVARDDLQNKAGRYYFTQAMALGRTSIYISPLDLNMEHGRVEEPHKPVLRFASPVYGPDGRKRGVLIINALMRGALERIMGGTRETGVQVMVVNSLGYWLRSPNPDDEWGFQIPSRATRTFGNDNPEAWRAMRDSPEAVVEAANGLYLSQDVHLDRIPGDGIGDWDVVQGAPLGEKGYFLRVIAFVPEAAMDRREAPLMWSSLALFVGGALAAALLSVFLSLALERARSARRAAIDRSQLLESALDDLGRAYAGRRRAEHQLEVRNLLLSAMSEASPDGILVVDHDDRHLYVNQRFLDMWDLPADVFEGRKCAEALSAAAPLIEDPEEFGRRVAYLYAHPSERDHSEIQLTDGRTLERHSVGLVQADGAYLGRLWNYRDITGRKLAERAVRESEARLNAILEGAADGILTMGPDGVIQSANPAAARIFGYGPGELEGRAVTVLQTEPVRSEHDDYLRRYMETGEAHIIDKVGREVEGRRKDGSVVPLELAVSETRVEKKRLFTGILRDISERKEAEAAIIEANELLQRKQARIDRDLMAAAAIQKSLLPSASPVTGNLEIDWTFKPSQHIGGDIFNLFALDETHLGAYILDVSGHGVPSALVTVSVSQVLTPAELLTRIDWRGRRVLRRPGEVMADLNRYFPMERFDMFFTISYLVLDTRTGELEYCNAGHPPPLLARASGEVEPLSEGGMLIGLGELAGPYPTGTAGLAPGDMVLLYTDGLTEYMDEKREQYGQARLEAVLSRVAGCHVDEALEEVMSDALAHGRGAPPDDDISMLCIRYAQTGERHEEER